MKILVGVKRVVDAAIAVRVAADGSDVDLADAKRVMNPFDEIALEEALRHKDAGTASEIIVVSIGDKAAQETLRMALAMGADRAILVESEVAPEPLAVAKLLRALVQKEQPGLVLLGKQAIDGDNHQTGQMLSALLGWGQGTAASRLEIIEGHAKVTCEVDGGRERLLLTLPAVVTADLRLNLPRYVKLPQLMQARKKPLTVMTPEELGVDPTPRLELLKVEAPVTRRAKIKLSSVAELVERLRNEARVIE